MTNNTTALVLGATGGIGGEMARQLVDAGWTVRAMKRGVAAGGEQRDGIAWVGGDAMERNDVLEAARGCAVIVHAVNPPGYRNWGKLVLPMIDNTIAAAKAEGATIVMPGTVYNYGADAFPVIAEDAPQHPATAKGAIRVQLEQHLAAAAGNGCRVIVVRAGDYFGPKVGNSWFAQGLIKPGTAVKRVNLPGDAGVGHQWSYLPDVARTMVELLARRDELDAFATFHMAGHWDSDGTQLAAAIRRVVLKRTGVAPAVGPFPWLVIKIGALFNTTLRELLDMRYLWKTPLRMRNERLLSVLGREPHTALDIAVEATLQGLGCLGDAEASGVPVRVG